MRNGQKNRVHTDSKSEAKTDSKAKTSSKSETKVEAKTDAKANSKAGSKSKKEDEISDADILNVVGSTIDNDIDEVSILDQHRAKQQAIAEVEKAGKGGKGGKGKGGAPAPPAELASPKADAKAAAAPAAKPEALSAGYNYGHYNWWDWPDDLSSAKNKGVDVGDDTPFDIKSHPKYKELTERFLGGLFKDKNLEMHNKGTASEAIDHD